MTESLFTESYLARFSGIARLYGQEALGHFLKAHVALIGIGGVGCWVAEALARSGIGTLTLVDLDDLCVTNTNRQLHATSETIGQSKALVMAERLRAINPEIVVHVRQEFYTEKNAAPIFAGGFDFVVDAIDAMRPKCHLLAQCRERRIPVVSSGGAGGRVRPDKIEVADLSRTHGCALMAQVRKDLRAHYHFPTGEGKKARKFGITAVFSSEAPRYPTADGCVSAERPANLAPGLRCDAGYGTATPIIGTFGFTIASVVLTALAGAEP
ncbi:tRNA threonylcarbamoyladenosine dehydratase [Roseibacillus ishigakijimensis]|uniref:tRNA threonylcarbamoyladenosine dehydratase n=1 Tax=Roseibacillus ishigakijimensis TaxID=454146 RepID=A0A934VM26_9BACT|nr:tRNA threonylcarbamoyladenosine dehydratase [Roseibacillus ishigakijimensis]MBK1833510.1 tRNA threonylcarbamoyladenosine dehydratase [Roseibacillus ishigakijimensis]